MPSTAPLRSGSPSKPQGSGATPISASELTPTTADLTGRQLGDYLLLRRLGQGGMAEVYLAEQLSLCRRVAFKVLRSNLALDANYIRRFRVEAQTVASLVHPNIVQVYDVGCIEGVHYIAQEYVLGKNLKQVLQTEKSLPIRTCVSIMRQVASALERAARSNIVHRDIKPENILITSGGEVKVADFGLARSEKSSSLELTQDNTALGTPLYMSPEQIEVREIDARSDIYSYGVTFYQLFAGRPPFEGESPIQVAWKHVNAPATPLTEAALNPEMPREIGEIIHKSLSKKVEDRYQSAAEILRDLRNVPIPSGQEEWSPDLEASIAVENASSVSKQDDATAELSRLLRVARPGARWSIARRIGVWAGATAVMFLVGGSFAWLNRPQFDLTTVRGAPRESTKSGDAIERKETARSQYFWATGTNTPESLQSVAKFFPPEDSADNSYYANLAEQRLAEYYLENFDWKGARPSFEKLSLANAIADRGFAAYGCAGLAHCAALDLDYDLEEKCLQELQQLEPFLSLDEWEEAVNLLSEFQQKRVKSAPSRLGDQSRTPFLGAIRG